MQKDWNSDTARIMSDFSADLQALAVSTDEEEDVDELHEAKQLKDKQKKAST